LRPHDPARRPGVPGRAWPRRRRPRRSRHLGRDHQSGGGVMGDIWIAISASVGLCVLLGGFVTFWMTLSARITTNKLTAERADKEAAKAHERIDAIIKEIGNQREATAKNIGRLEATNDALAQAIKGMTTSLTHVVERLDRLADRLTP